MWILEGIKMKKILYFLMILLLASFVSATTSWYTWGNVNYNGADQGADNILFGSNYPYGTLTLTQYIEALSPTFPPIVADLNSDGENEIIFVGDETLYVYSPTLEFIDSVTVTNSFSNPVILNYESDDDIEIVVCEDTDIMIYELNATGLSLQKEWANKCGDIGADQIWADINLRTQNAIGDIDYSYSNDVFTVYRTDTSPQALRVWHTDIDNGTRFSDTSTPGSQEERCSGDFGNGLVVDDIDKDGIMEYISVSTDSSGTDVNVYEFGTGALQWNFVLGNQQARNDSCNIAVAQVGTEGSYKEIVVSWYDTEFNRTKERLIDYTGNNIFHHQTPNTNKSFSSVVDYDADGLNEICYINGTTVICKNYLNAVNVEANLSDSYVDSNFYFAMGEYDDSEGNSMEVITKDGVYQMRNKVAEEAELHKIYDFSGFDSKEAQIYPVSLTNTESSVKEFLLFEDDRIATYLATSATYNCGNNVCDATETIYTCPQDCLNISTNASDILIAEVRICPNEDYIWLNGTEVTVDAKAYSANYANLEMKLELYAGQSFEYDSDWQDISSEAFITFDTYANYTNYGNFVLTARPISNPSLQAIYSFPLSISATEGWVKANGCSVYTSPTYQKILDEEEAEIDEDTDGITSFVNTFFGFTGLSKLIIWLLIMGILGMTIIFYGFYANWNSGIVFGLFAVMEIVTLLIGVMLGFIPIGVIIILVILSLAIGAIIWKMSFMGA